MPEVEFCWGRRYDGMFFQAGIVAGRSALCSEALLALWKRSAARRCQNDRSTSYCGESIVDSNAVCVLGNGSSENIVIVLIVPHPKSLCRSFHFVVYFVNRMRRMLNMHMHPQIVSEQKEKEVFSPTNQDHWPILHMLKLANPGMLFLLPLYCHANDVEQLVFLLL